MYTLRLPITLPIGQGINLVEEKGKIDNLEFTLTKQDNLYILTLNGFLSEEEAKSYINNIWSGLAWLLLNRGLSGNIALDIQKIKFVDDPIQAAKNLSRSFGGIRIDGPVDGLIDGNMPAIYPTEKKLKVLTAGSINVTLGYSIEEVIRYLREGSSFPNSSTLITNDKLRVAFELYSAFYTESSLNARFLSLIMALEALATAVERTNLVLALIDKWKQEVDCLLQEIDSNSEDAASLDAFRRELLFRKGDSIRRQIYRLVKETLDKNGDEDADIVATKAKSLYDLRSKLVHEGKLNQNVLDKAVSDAQNVVQRVLIARFLQEVR